MSSTEPENKAVAPSPRWPIERIFLWTVLAAVAIWHQGGTFLAAMKPPDGKVADFFQEWASARNYLEGLPTYAEQHESLRRHTGMKADRHDAMLPWNAHPPASVLLALPYSKMSYANAHFAWNLTMLPLLAISIGLIFHGLKLPFRIWSLLPSVAVLLYCFPLFHQFVQGQLNVVLLFLITLSWTFDRNDRPWLAGAVLGMASALKLFPAFLFLYFVARSNWKAIVSGGASFLLVNGLALLLFGGNAFQDYVQVVLPSLQHYRSSWANLSLTGFWMRIFDPEVGEQVIPLWRSPILASVCAYGSSILVSLLVALGCWKSRKNGLHDGAFALCLVGMVLASPIAWSHYFLLLCLPLALLWRDTVGLKRWVFLAVLLLIWITPSVYYLIGMGKEAARKWDSERYQLRSATPGQNLMVISFLTYVLLVLFGLVFSSTIRTTKLPTGQPEPSEIA